MVENQYLSHEALTGVCNQNQPSGIAIVLVTESLGGTEESEIAGIEDVKPFPAYERYAIEVQEIVEGGLALSTVSVSPGELTVGHPHLLYAKRLHGYCYYAVIRATDLTTDAGLEELHMIRKLYKPFAQYC